MAIQPIDLQILYQQLSNVSQNNGTQQTSAQIVQGAQLNSIKNENLNNSKKVNSTSNENTNSASVNPDGSNKNSFNNQNPKNKSKNNTEIQPDNNVVADDNSYLGRIIDISR